MEPSVVKEGAMSELSLHDSVYKSRETPHISRHPTIQSTNNYITMDHTNSTAASTVYQN